MLSEVKRSGVFYMSVKGIVILNANADRHFSQRALYSLENFSANLTTKSFEGFSREQRNLSEELRERFKRAAEDDAKVIDYELYTRDDEKKSPAVINSEISILNPSLSKIKAPGRLSSPASCKTCANRRYRNGLKERAAQFQTPMPLTPTINADLVLGTGHLQDRSSYSQMEEEHAHYVIDPDELEAYEESRDEDGIPTLPKPQPHLEHTTSIRHVVNSDSASQSQAVHHHHHGEHAAAIENISAQLRVDICPECGRAYISGTVANTKVQFFSDLDESNPYHQQLLDEGEADFRGNLVEIDA